MSMRPLARDRLQPADGTVLQGFAHQVSWLTGAEGAAIALCEPRGLVCRASVGNAPAVGSKVGVESRFTHECLATSRIMNCRDVAVDPRFAPAPAGELSFRSAVAIPITADDAVLGVMVLLSSRPSAFEADDLAVAQQYSDMLQFLLGPRDVEEELAPEAQVRAGRLVMFPAAQSTLEDPKARPRPISQSGAWIGLAAAACLVLIVVFLAVRHRGSAGTASAPQRATSAAIQSAPRAPDVEPAAGEQASHPVATSGQAETGKEAGTERNRRGETGGEHEAMRSSGATVTPPRVLPPAEPARRGAEALVAPAPAVMAKAQPAELPILVPPTTHAIAPASPAIASARGFALARTLQAHSSWVTTLAFSPDGRRLASGSWDRTVKFWDVATGETIRSIGEKNGKIQALAFSADGRWLATENFANEVTIWDAQTGTEVRRFAGSKPVGLFGNNYVYSISFSPDGRWLASGMDDRTVRVWDLKTGQVVRDLRSSPRIVIYIAFSPDGRLLATGGDDKTISVWDVATGKVARTLAGHQDQVYAVQFSPDGRWLASASRDKTVKLWEVASGREVRTLTGHRKSVTSLAFSPDGRWLASGSWDDTIKLWEVKSGREVQTLAGHTHHVYSVAFDSGGRWLASGSEDGTMKLWRAR